MEPVGQKLIKKIMIHFTSYTSGALIFLPIYLTEIKARRNEYALEDWSEIGTALFLFYIIGLFIFNKEIENSILKYVKKEYLPLSLGFILTLINVVVYFSMSKGFLIKLIVVWSVAGMQWIYLKSR